MTQSTSRRAFLRQAALLAGAGAATPLALNLAAMGAASAQSASGGYKALVCIFLYGGNDHHNTIIPFDLPTNAAYKGIRTGIGLDSSELSATVLNPDNPWDDGRTAGRQMAFHPGMTALTEVFNQGHLALAMNVGTLVAPVKDYATTPPSGLPPKLFSHNDQQSVWQSGLAEGAISGWGGRMADLMLAGNGQGSSFTSISAAGNAVFMSGQDAVQYQVGSNGPVVLKPVFGNAASGVALQRIMQRGSAQLFEGDHAAIATRAIGLQAKVSAAIDTTLPTDAAYARLDTAIGLGNPLAAQLKIVARMIAGRSQLVQGESPRQVFFVSLGGFDHHDFLLNRQGPLLTAVSDAMAGFYAATVSLGVQDQVTAFTGSDFGRTLSSNGDGSDHGWGSYHMVMGGAVKGRRWYGQLPLMSLAKGDDPVGSGRLVPKMAVDQYGATMGLWMGLNEGQLLGTEARQYKDGVFPNLNRFGDVQGNHIDQGFMTL
jgi:uncharacterized protein (DUF1501 family)